MSMVDSTFARWLQSEADYVVAADAAAVGRWGVSARTTERVTSIATMAAAQAQAACDLTFWSRAPFAIDVHQIVGDDWAGELGRIVTLAIDQLGYDDGVDVFVFDVEIDRATNISSVTVLRPLRGG